ncbi:MAG: SnoaL-like domain-containing protein [Gammaproteobacteria bacterium]|nr:SnoaL-like domain-containing protein [Gammaproteobacteria bacterium]MBT7369964.1 SnoaL-like domain-containing protein [Gammaproteobacteria bacterium]
MADCNEGYARAQAVQEIEYLRRWYAKATDMIGEDTEDAIAEGRAVYHRIFAEKAELKTSADGEPEIGPDAWVTLVHNALGPIGPTQHLIGTQLVELETLELDADCNIVSGQAHMESYVQAWHEMLDEKVWLYLGTYFDEVKYTPGKGWQIHGMSMRQSGGETRYMDAAVGKAK